jgi:predicted metal-dependent hydrolase
MTLPDNYILQKKEVKHARIRVSENLSVRVLVPESFSNSDIQSLIRKKKKWIDKNLIAFSKRKDTIKLHYNQLLLFGNRYNYFFTTHLHNKIVINHSSKTIQSKTDLLDKSEQLKWYKRFAKQYITERLVELAKKHRFRFNKVFIRDQRTKWGNCSTEKNLSFNWRLIKTPQFVIDYLIIHELVHTRTMNHHQKFWTELKSLYPECREAVKWLDKYGNSL